ncbi:MAG: hypothetical protein LQ350_003983 [Teloschistes chrysophthalmus]|nr:MAG: hypothetical protein LQ350_003983 [Niorma chrysophthalma]
MDSLTKTQEQQSMQSVSHLAGPAPATELAPRASSTDTQTDPQLFIAPTACMVLPNGSQESSTKPPLPRKSLGAHGSEPTPTLLSDYYDQEHKSLRPAISPPPEEGQKVSGSEPTYTIPLEYHPHLGPNYFADMCPESRPCVPDSRWNVTVAAPPQLYDYSISIMGVESTWTAWDSVHNCMIWTCILPVTAKSDTGVFVHGIGPSTVPMTLPDLSYDTVPDRVRDGSVKSEPEPTCDDSNIETTHITPQKPEWKEVEDVMRRDFFYDPVHDRVRDDLIKSEPGPIYDNSNNRETTPATSRKRKRVEKEGIQDLNSTLQRAVPSKSPKSKMC